MPALRDSLLRHWPLKLAALALSLILWLVVAAGETTSQLLTVNLELDVPPGLALTRPAPQLRALVTGPGRELIKLYAQPPAIRAAVPGNATLPVYRLEVVPSDIRVPRSANVTIQDLEPRQVELELDRVVVREVPVAHRAVVEAESGFAVSGPLVVTPRMVRVTGPRSLVMLIDSLTTEPIEVRGVTEAFERTVPLDTARQRMVHVVPHEVVLAGRVRRM